MCKSKKYMDILKINHTRSPCFLILLKSDNGDSGDCTHLATKKKNSYSQQ